MVTHLLAREVHWVNWKAGTYKSKHNKAFMWQSRRLFGRHHLRVYAKKEAALVSLVLVLSPHLADGNTTALAREVPNVQKGIVPGSPVFQARNGCEWLGRTAQGR
eukprot:Skav221917  [mRNA]  locus=scaffold5163:33501:40447:- [translate_table: standard]